MNDEQQKRLNAILAKKHEAEIADVMQRYELSREQAEFVVTGSRHGSNGAAPAAAVPPPPPTNGAPKRQLVQRGDPTAERMWHMIREGKTVPQIALLFGISESAVHRTMNLSGYFVRRRRTEITRAIVEEAKTTPIAARPGTREYTTARLQIAAKLAISDTTVEKILRGKYDHLLTDGGAQQ